MKCIELWFKKRTTQWLDRLISFRTLSPYSHVELVLGATAPELELGSNFTGFSADGSVGGTRPTVLHWDPNKWERVIFRELVIGAPGYIEVLETAEELLYRPYDYFNLKDLLVGKTPPKDPYALQCAEFCTYCLQSAGIFTFVHPGTVTPGSLYLMSKAREEVINGTKGNLPIK